MRECCICHHITDNGTWYCSDRCADIDRCYVRATDTTANLDQGADANAAYYAQRLQEYDGRVQP